MSYVSNYLKYGIAIIAMVIIATIALLVTTEQAYADTIVSGPCGVDTEYTLSDYGVLTISGNGYMGSTPWDSHKAEIKEVVIEDGVKNIKEAAFSDCSSLKRVTIPNSVTSIGSRAFDSCINLATVNIPNSVTDLRDNSFQGCFGLISMTIPAAAFEPDEFSKKNHFGRIFNNYLYGSGQSGAMKITQTYSNGSVASEQTYYIPSGLKEVTILGPGNIPTCMFEGFSNLTKIAIEGAVEEIHTNAFSRCTGISSITMSESVKTIYPWGFNACRIESVYITDLSSYLNIEYKQGTPPPTMYGADLYICGEKAVDVTIPSDIKQIPARAFLGCKSIERVTIPDNVISIGMEAFRACSNLDIITMADKVNTIGNDAFAECKLSKVYISDLSSYLDISFGNLNSHPTCNCADLYIDGEKVKDMVVPDDVRNIKSGAFYNCKSIERLFLSDRLISIGDYAFDGCANLEDVIIPKGLMSIGEHCFSDCNSLFHIDIPNTVTELGKYAFNNCKKLESIEIPASIELIDSYMFKGCSNLRSIILAEGVKTISTDAFYQCGIDLKVYIPESVKQIVNGNSSYVDDITVCTVPGAYITYNHPDKWSIKYLFDSSGSEENHYLGFKSGTITMESEGALQLSDYLNTDFDISECEIQLSDDELFFYDDGEVANFGEGQCDVTVTNGDYSTSARIIAQDMDVERMIGLSFATPIITLNKGESITNAVVIAPENADINSVVWNSSDTSIATVENGLVTGISSGTTTITAFSEDDNTIKAQYTVNVVIPLSGIIVPGETTLIEKGQSKQLLYYKYPADTTVDDITFASSDPDIVEVDEDGVITAKASGVAEIQISSGDVSATVDVDVFNLLDGISLDVKTAQVKARESLQLNVIYEPEDTTFRDVSWTSSKESVATVDENGIVTAHGKGLTTITATAGKYTAKCTIMCPDIPISEVIIPDSVEIKYGETYNTEIEILPTTTTDDTPVTWASSDDSIFTVSNDGEITPTGIGSATLTASVGEFEETATVVIEKGDPEYDLPEGLSAHCGQKFEDISLPDGFTWEDPEQEVGVVGTNSFGIIYTPDDTDHYNIVSDLQTEVTVEHLFAEQWSSDDVNHWHECVCGEKEDEAIHTYSDWNILTEPTCTAEGERERTCSVCGHVNKESIEAKGHDWYADYKTDIEATCIGAGEKSIHCRVCGIKDADSIVTIEPLGHVYAETIVEPTCSQKGYTLHVCGRCGDTYKDNEVSASGHSFGEWITDEESSCTKEGCKHRECSGCGYIETQNVDKKDHIFSTEYVIDKAPTCTTDGSKSFHCTAEGCSATTGSVVISAEGHKYGDWEEINKVTCTEDGVYERVCDVCGEKETIQVEKIGHIWTKDYFIDKVATLDEDGSMMTHCAVCDAKNEESAILIKKPEFYDLSVTSYTYDGRVKRPTPYISDIEDNEIDNTNYTVSYANNKNAGTATAIVKLKGKYEGEIKMGFIIEKARNPFSIRAKTVTIKQKKVAKAKQTIAVSKAFYMAKAKGKVTFTRKNGNKKIVIYKTGKVIVKKGLKKGTYKVKIRVKDSGNANYKARVKNVTLRVRVVK